MTIDEYVVHFEDEIKRSADFRSRLTPENHKKLLLKNHTVNKMDIKDFVSSFRQQSKYPQERLDNLAYKLIDIKLQIYLIEFDLGANNDLMGLIDREPENEEKKAHIRFMNTSFDQSLILKSRILWERVMNFVYYLETGNKLKSKKGLSIKAVFFEFAKNSGWDFLCDYQEYVEWFDKVWRNPETHNDSILRQRMISGTMDNDEVNRILGYVNLISIIAGRSPSYRFWTYGMSEDKKIT